MTDLTILLPRQGSGSPEAATVRKRLMASRGSVVALDRPVLGPGEIGLQPEQFTTYYFKYGIDFRRIDANFRLREIVLLKCPANSRVGFWLAYLWTFPESTFQIDSIRIPKAGHYDSRNNPLGKNPGNIWAFSRGLSDGGRGVQRTLHSAAPSETILSGYIESAAIERFIRCHSEVGDTVSCWGDSADLSPVERLTNALGRSFEPLPPGASDSPSPRPRVRGTAPVQSSLTDSQDVLQPTGGIDQPPTLRYYICDCRFGLVKAEFPPITDVVTSPPYNLDYRPFNVPRSDPHSRHLVAPQRVGYRDALAEENHRELIRSTLQAIDPRLDSKSADIFVNFKNDYGGGECQPPFWLLDTAPESWQLTDILVWRYDISFDPARLKYKPYYEWVFRFTRGTAKLHRPHVYLRDFYLPIVKGNSLERVDLVHPAVFPTALPTLCLREAGHNGLVADPFAGSGTTLAAARRLGRPSIGFEADPRFIADIERRVGIRKRVGRLEDANGLVVRPPKPTEVTPVIQDEDVG